MADDARKMAQEIAELKEAVRALQTGARLGYSAIDGGALVVKDNDGVVRQRIGRQTDGTYTVVDTNGITPPMPAPPILIAGPISVTIASYGNTVDNHAWPYDFAAIEVHVSTSQAFTPSPATKVGEFTTGGGSQIVRGEPDVPLYVVLVGRNTSGLLGVPSEEISATPLAIVTDEEIASIEDSVAGLTERIDGTDASLDTINAVTDAVKFDITSVSERVDGAEGSLSDIVTIQLPGKNKVNYSTTQPGTNENTAGDTWFVFLNGEVVEVWQGEGGTDWTQLTIGGATLTNLDAGTITAGVLAAARIAAGTIDTGHLAAGAVETEQLGALAVTAEKIAANAIEVGHIAAGAVTAGSLAADAITGKTITGGVFQTDTTGERLVIDPGMFGGSEIAFYSGLGSENSPGRVRSTYVDVPDTYSMAAVTLEGPTLVNAMGNVAQLTLQAMYQEGNQSGAISQLRGDDINLAATRRAYMQVAATENFGMGQVDVTSDSVQLYVWNDTSTEVNRFRLYEDGAFFDTPLDVAGRAVGSDTGWQYPTLAGTWANYGGGFTPARYRFRDDRVYLEGLVRSGSGLIFTLPPGYRPVGGTLLFACVDGTNTANARVDVDTAGNVSLLGGNNAFVSLAGISFFND